MPLAKTQVIGSEDLGIVRARRYGNPFGIRVEHVDRRVVHDVVVAAAAMVVLLLDGDAELREQRRELGIGCRHAGKLCDVLERVEHARSRFVLCENGHSRFTPIK